MLIWRTLSCIGLLLALEKHSLGHASYTECAITKAWWQREDVYHGGDNQSLALVTEKQCRKTVTSSLVASLGSKVWQNYMQAFTQVMTKLKWTTAVLISDETTDMIIDDISQALVDINCRYIHYVIREKTSAHRIRSWINGTYHARPHTGLHYILIAGDRNMQRVLDLAGMYDSADKGKTALYFFSRWLVISGRHGEGLVAKSIGTLDHVAVMALQDVGETHVNKKIYSSQCPRHNKEDAGMCNSDSVNLFTLYYKPEGKVFCCTGVWSNQSILLTGHLFPNTKFGFNNRTLRVGTNMWPPFVHRNPNSTEEFTGFTIELLREVANTLNFSYTLHVPADGEWGMKANGRWTGLVGDLYYNNVDLVAAPIAQTTFREEACDFTYPYFYEFSVILIKMPDPMGQKWRVLLDIFSWPVMVLVIVSLPVTALVVYFVEKTDPVPKRRHIYMTSTGVSNYTVAAWYLFGALLSQGGILNPKSVSGRTLIGFWWLYCIVVTATFTGQLMATLTVTSVKPPFDNIAEMVAQDGYKWGTAAGGTVIFVSLKSSRDPSFKDVWQGILKFNATDPEVLSEDIYVHFRKVQEGSYAYLTDKSGVLDLLSSNCELKILKEEFFPTQYAFALPEGSPLVDMFSDRIFTIQESGLLKIWEKNWWPRNNCTGLPRTQAVMMGMKDVQSAYYVLVIGVGVGLLVLLVEKAKNLFDRRKLKKPSSARQTPSRNDSVDNFDSVEMECTDMTTVTCNTAEDNWQGLTYNNIKGEKMNIRQIKQPD